MIRVCLIAPIPPPYGGIANWTDLITKYINIEKKNIEIVQINTATKKRATEGRHLYDRIIISGIQMLQINNNLNNIIKNKRPDVVHITSSGSLGLFRDLMLVKNANKKNIKIVYHIRFGRIPEIAKNNTFEWKLLKKVLLYINKVIVLDKQTYNALKEIVPQKVVEIPNPINLKELASLKRTEYKLTIVYLGWVVPSKGIQELLEAWDIVQKRGKYNNWNLTIIGPYQNKYLTELNEHYNCKNVKFTGEQEHDKALQAVLNSEIFTLPSYTEGFPNVVVEAMAMGKAIIATNVGAIPEMLENGCGVVIKTKESQILANEIMNLMDNEKKRRELGNKAHKKVLELYDIDIIFEQYKELWIEK